jgi:hypothetical protein
MIIESKGVRFAIPAVLIFVFATITFYHLGNRPLIEYDESIYAQVAREALQNHSQLDLTWLGYIAQHKPPQFFDKPPLIIWMVETSQTRLRHQRIFRALLDRHLRHPHAAAGLSCSPHQTLAILRRRHSFRRRILRRLSIR